MQSHHVALLLLGLLGCAAGQTFSSIQSAVETLPELSLLNTNTASISLADKLRNPDFVGTLFAPTNAALQPLQAAVGGDDLSSLIGDPQQVNDVFSTAVVPDQVLTLADLKDGMKLTTLNGNQVTVTVVNAAGGGRAVFINKARISTANIAAGKAIIHEVAGLVVPASYQDMLDALVAPEDMTKAQPTLVYDGTASTGTTTSPTTTTTSTGTTSTSTSDSTASDSVDGRVLATASSPAPAASTTATKSAAGAAWLSAALLAVPALLGALL